MTSTLRGKEWDAICDGCGLCCAFVNSNIGCPSLNVKTRRCMNYKKRFKTDVCQQLTPSNILPLHAQGVLPDSCAYVAHIKGEPQPEIPEVALVPFALAPGKIRRNYRRARKKWLRIARAQQSAQ
jgi:uncharacterized cysteine cluster protein YcgN (CxxCxxCC family)